MLEYKLKFGGVVSQVGGSDRVVPFPLGQNCPRKIAMSMSL